MAERVLLLNPCYKFIYRNATIKEGAPYYPSLALASLAGKLTSGGHEVKILDLNLFRNPDKALTDAIREFRPGFAGITFSTPLFYESDRIVKLIKKTAVDIIVIGGGSHCSALPRETLAESSYDIICFGEGEETLSEIVSGKNYGSIDGICYRGDDGALIMNGERDLLGDLDELPFPKWDLFEIEKYKVTTFCVPPTIYRMLLLEDLSKYDLSKLRHCCSAGEPLNPEIIKTCEKHTGIQILDFFGQTETVALLGNFRCMPMKPGSVGKPTPGHYVSIVDEEGNELPPNEEGNIAVKTEQRPPGLFKEYWKDPEKNNEVFKQNWYYTGDKAYKDKDGYFWFVGRSDDVIKASGYRIGPFEVESALIEHPAVTEAAVVGSPDPVRGEIVKAFVILAPGYKSSEKLTEELQEHVKNVTAPYKYPREIEYVKELPKTISGKIKRKELREAEFRKKSGK